MQENQGQSGLKEKRVTEGIEERKETGAQLGRRENPALAPAHVVEPVGRRENQGKREPRAVQALATKERRESPAPLGPLVPLALQGPQLGCQPARTARLPSARTAQLLPVFLDPEDQPDHKVRQAPRDHQELMENRVILERTEKLVLMDLQVSQESQVMLDLKERRETVERVSLAPGGPQDLQDPQEQESDLLLWTWKVRASQIWNLFGDCLAHQVLLVPLGLLVPLHQAQDRVLGHLDHREKMERLVNLVCLVCRVLMASQEFLVPKEKRVIQASWVFQEQLERRGVKERLVCQDLQERLDWLVCLDPEDLLGHLDLLGLLDQVIMLDLMTWRALVEVSLMDFLASEDQKENRVLLACLDFRVNLGSPVYQVRRASKVQWEETDSQGWMASLDLRDQKVTEVTKERGVSLVEMELDSKVHPVHLDHQDKSSIRHPALMVLLAVSGLREDLVYLVKLDSLVRWDQRVTEEIRALQAME